MRSGHICITLAEDLQSIRQCFQLTAPAQSFSSAVDTVDCWWMRNAGIMKWGDQVRILCFAQGNCELWICSNGYPNTIGLLGNSVTGREVNLLWMTLMHISAIPSLNMNHWFQQLLLNLQLVGQIEIYEVSRHPSVDECWKVKHSVWISHNRTVKWSFIHLFCCGTKWGKAWIKQGSNQKNRQANIIAH